MTHDDQNYTEFGVDCQKVKENNFIARYITEKLPPREAAAFERHYLGCKECFDALELTHAATLGHVKVPTVAPATNPAIGGLGRWVLASVFAAIAVLFGVFYLKPTRAVEPQPVASSRPDTSVLAQLASLQAPASPPNLIRGVDSNDARTRFQEGMAAYSAADFTTAASRLSEAARLDPSHDPTTFYLGVSYLMMNRFDDALEQLSKLNSADNSYAEDSHWYAANAYLKKKDAANARRELMAVLGLNDVRSREAEALLQRLDALGF